MLTETIDLTFKEYGLVEKERNRWAIYKKGFTNLTFDKKINDFRFELLPDNNVRFTLKEAKQIIDKLEIIRKLK